MISEANHLNAHFERGLLMAYRTRAEIEADYKKKMDRMRQERAEALGKAAARDRKAETQAKIRIGGIVLKVLRESYENYVDQEISGSGKSREDFPKLDARDINPDRLISFLRGQENRGGYLSSALGFPSEAGSFVRSMAASRQPETED